uniref:Putative secreted protein n=1 Tax=Anopheles marajoara TaxID=58244 RepID=A0A2M4CEM4_9DIPT
MAASFFALLFVCSSSRYLSCLTLCNIYVNVGKRMFTKSIRFAAKRNESTPQQRRTGERLTAILQIMFISL